MKLTISKDIETINNGQNLVMEAEAEGMSGSGVMIATYDFSDQNNPTCDKTFEELSTAIENGAFVVAKSEFTEGEISYFMLESYATDQSIMFHNIEYGDEGVFYSAIIHTPEGIEYFEPGRNAGD